jgi:SNF2 family DNA or RNA helicase
MTPLDATVILTTPRRLSSEEKTAIYALPGAKVRHDRHVRVPIHLAERIYEALVAVGLQPQVTVDHRGVELSAEEAERHVRAGELRDGYWDNWYRPFQREGVIWAVRRRSGHLWHSPGAGKTASAIAWALAAPGIVVAVTRAGIRLHWGREVQKVSEVVPWVSDPGSRTRKSWVAPQDYLDRCREEGRRPFFVVGWEELARLVYGNPDAVKGNTPAGFLSQIPLASLVMDEIHNGKSRKRKKWTVSETGRWNGTSLDNRVAAAEILSRRATRRLGTTGTPIPDRVRDLWGQLDLVEPEAWGGYWRWAKRYCNGREGQYGGLEDSGSSRLPELKARLEWVRDRVPVEVSHGELPEKRREVIYVPPDRLSQPTAGARDEVKTAPDAETRLEAMLRLACSRKRREIIEQTVDAVKGGSKVVIFTGRRADCDVLFDQLGTKLKGHRVWVAHGGHSTADRDEARTEYMATQTGCVLVATGESMGEGIDLQDTDLAIIAMLPWTPRAVGQWEARFHRPGMTRPVIVRYLIAEGTVDEHVCEILLGKLPAVADVVADQVMATASHDLKGLGNREEILSSLVSRLKLRSS